MYETNPRHYVVHEVHETARKRPFKYANSVGSVWVVEWYEANGQYRINENPNEDVAKYLYRGLRATSDITEVRLTEVRTVESLKV